MPPLSVECALGHINKLLIHFECPASLGFEMKTSMGLMNLELGVSLQPFQESYVRYGSWTTPYWLRSLWEKCDVLNIQVEFHEDTLRLPRSQDKCLILEFWRIRYQGHDLERLNALESECTNTLSSYPVSLVRLTRSWMNATSNEGGWRLLVLPDLPNRMSD